MIRKLIFTAVAVCTFALTPVFGQATIERIAPENSVLIIGSRNVQSLMDRIKGTGLYDLWQTDSMKAMRADAMKQVADDLNNMFQELGVEEGSLVPPSGAAGFAIFPILDEEMGITQAAMIAVADYGDAEKADKTHSLIQAALTKGEKEGQLEYEEKDVNGKTVLSIDLAKMKPAEEGGDDMGGEFNPMMPMPNPSEFTKAFEKLHYVRNGNVLMLSSNFEQLSDALEAAEGKGAKSVTERAEFQAVNGKIGESDAYVILLTRDVMDLIGSMDPMGMAMMAQPMLRAMFGKVDGYGMGVRFDGSNAMVEQKFTVYMPEGKKGFTTLLDNPTPRGSVPGFVSADAISYTHFNFEFEGLMEVLRQVVNSNPMLAGEGGPVLDQIEPMVQQVTAALGNQVHMSSSATKPFDPKNHHSVFAIQCTKPQDFENVFAELAAQGNLDARDFLGQRIYSMDPAAMGMPADQAMSIGIGGGLVIIGQTPAVEQTLRATSEPTESALSKNAEFQRALAALPQQDAVAWGYSDAVSSAEVQIETVKQMQKSMMEDMGDMDPEFKAEMEAEMNKQMAAFDKIDFDLMRKYLGPSVWQITSTNDGFDGVFYMLEASKKE